jgi:hypothetical protein
MVRELQAAGRSAGDVAVPGLPGWARPLVAERSERRVETIARLGVNVVGDPSCLLLPDEPAADPADLGPDRISVEAAALAVSGVVSGALQRQRALAAQLKDTRQQGRAASPALADVGRRDLARELWARQTARWRRRRRT